MTNPTDTTHTTDATTAQTYTVPVIDPETGEGWDEEIVAESPREAIQHAPSDVHIASAFVEQYFGIEDAEKLVIIDPKGQRGSEFAGRIDVTDTDEGECPLGDHPAANETPQNTPTDDTDHERDGGEQE